MAVEGFKAVGNLLSKNLEKNAGETGKAAGATVLLVNALNSTLSAQSQLAQTMIAVGRASEVNAAAFTMAGLNAAQQTKILTELNNESVRTSRDSVKAALNTAALLGKNTQAISQLTAFNEQVLGFTAAQNKALMESSNTLGADFGVNSEKLISAIQSLSQTLIKTAATYGSSTSAALEKAVMFMTAELGTGATTLINEVVSRAAAGTRESGLLAARLGVSLEAFKGNDPQAIKTTIETIISRAGDILLPLRDAGMPEFAMAPIMERFGLSPEFLILAERMQSLEDVTGGTTNALLQRLVMQNDINTQISEIQLELTKAFLPTIQVLADIVQRIVQSPDGKFIIVALSIAIPTFLLMASFLATIAVTVFLLSSTLAVAFAPLLIIASIIGVIAGASAVMASDTEEIKEETKRQNEILQRNEQQQIGLLGQLNTQIIASQAIQQAQVDLLEQIEQKETTVNVGETLSIHDSFVQPNRVAGMGGK